MQPPEESVEFRRNLFYGWGDGYIVILNGPFITKTEVYKTLKEIVERLSSFFDEAEAIV